MDKPLTVFLALAVASSVAAQQPKLDRLAIQATGDVVVTVPAKAPPEGSIYRTSDGEWAPLEVRFEDNRASFGIPADAGGRTIVLLNVPEWLVLDDDQAPRIERVVIDDEPVEVAEEIDLGHRPGGPRKITVLFHDNANPIDVASAVITLDGALLPDEAITDIGARNGDETRFVQVVLPDPTPRAHVLRFRVPDAAATPHFACISLRFNSGPLLRDGGFEEVKADGGPAHWSANKWSTNAETRAELRIIEGGRSGDRCAEIKGIAGGLNLLFGQKVALSADRTYVVRGFYQATSPRGHLSMINESKDENAQYLNSPRLEPVEEWTPFEWRFTTKPSSGYTLYLRNTSKGFVRFDDVVMEEVQEP